MPAEYLKRPGAKRSSWKAAQDQASVIQGLVSAGIPVMAHVGLRPQSVHQLGGYRVQRDAEQLTIDAQAAQDAGAFAIVLECIPQSIAGQITEQLRIPTIGIGAGPQCDGQVLVLHDLLGLTAGYIPRFSRQYLNLKQLITDAVVEYRNDIQQGAFPGVDQSFD